MVNTNMQKRYGKHSTSRRWVGIMIYLKSNVILLADVFENFRKTCLLYYKLYIDPCLSWDAMLKMTNIELELMTNIDMFQFIEKGMRGGGVSYIANRYRKAKTST